MLLNDYLLPLDIELTEEQLQQFSLFYELLITTNEKMNLTAIRDEQGILIKHFVDSIIYSREAVAKAQPQKILDLGTGAGFPGIPLSILYPSYQVDLVDALNKRVEFLKEVVTTLNLPHTNCYHGRGEDLGKDPSFREMYDLALARAVSYLPTLSEYLLPFVKIGGYAIVTKELPYEEEIKKSEEALQKLGGAIEDITLYTLPQVDNKRCIITIKKIKETPLTYPRRAGIPLKRPL